MYYRRLNRSTPAVAEAKATYKKKRYLFYCNERVRCERGTEKSNLENKTIIEWRIESVYLFPIAIHHFWEKRIRNPDMIIPRNSISRVLHAKK